MTNRERSGIRDLAYSTWHRKALSDDASFIDIDWVEWRKSCYRTLAVYETAYDNGRNDSKPYFVIQRLAKLARINGYLVLYAKDGATVTGFRVKRVYPRLDDEFVRFTPAQWAEHLRRLRMECGHAIAAPPDELPVTIASLGCATCGRPPDGLWRDGSPIYRCSHPPVTGIST